MRRRDLGCVAALAALTACSIAPSVPDAESVAGLRPSGTVTLEEAVAGGAEAGRGTLHFRGRSYPFRLVGGVTGPGGGVALRGSGTVYRLERLSDFAGIYTQGSGPPGIDTSSRADLWLRNEAGVIVHVRGEREGVSVSLGRSHVVVELIP